MKTIENINEITSVLTDVQKQILKDTINCGMWGDGSGDMLFVRYEYVDAFTEWAKQ